MNRATLVAITGLFLLADIWLHYFFFDMWKPNLYVVLISVSIVALFVIRAYYYIKKEI